MTERAVRRPAFAGLLFALGWLACFGMLQYSVVRFRVRIVLTLTAGAIALALWLLRRRTVQLSPGPTGLVLGGSALAGLALPLFSYLPHGWEWTARAVLAAGALAAALLLWRGSVRAAWLSAVAAYATASVIAIVTDPAPRIDVWVTLQQAADALARGANFYAVTWTDSPGVQDAFTYLPWTAVLLAPGRWLAGDVRWMQLLWVLVLAAGFWQLAVAARAEMLRRIGSGPDHAHEVTADALEATADAQAPTTGSTADPAWRDPRWCAAAVTALLLLAPGTLTQIDQAWTEPLLLVGITWWAVLVAQGRAWWAVLPLALACASKQHLALVLPLLLLWRPFGATRTIATGAATGLLISPWFLTAPADFVHDTITLLVGFHPITFANTWYLYFLNEHGITLPFWITGLVALGTLALAALFVVRRQPPMGELLRWVALVLLAANLVNKQAFYNQYWLVGGLVALSLVADRLAPTPPLGAAPAGRATRATKTTR